MMKQACILPVVVLLACGGATDRQMNDGIDPDQAADISAESDFAAETEDAPDAPGLPDTEITPEAPPLVVMTFNVLCSFCNKDYDPWEDRLVYFSDIFARHEPDLVGLQELFLGTEVQQILDLNPGYAALFWQDPAQPYLKDYADAVIMYRDARFEVLEHGFYWLSPTPDEPLAGGWAESNLARLVAWAHMLDLASGIEIYFASTHFDNNPPNQEMSAPLFVDRTAQWAVEMPAIVVGDFNSKPDSPAYATLTAPHRDSGITLANTFDLVPQWSLDSNRDPVPEYDPAHRIDHIFLGDTANFTVVNWVADLRVYGHDDLYPSDHRALATTLKWNE